MSSSKVLSSFSLVDTKVPVGTDDFIARYREQIEQGSELGLKLTALEHQHQLELAEARERGREEGEAAAIRKDKLKLQQFETQFRQTLHELVEYRDAVYRQAQQQLFEFAFRLADTITSARGEVEQQTVLETIDRCLSEILDKSKLRMRINPSQADYVRSHLGELNNPDTLNSIITIEADPRVASGGCIIETDSGSADATLSSQLEQLKQQLLKLDS